MKNFNKLILLLLCCMLTCQVSFSAPVNNNPISTYGHYDDKDTH